MAPRQQPPPAYPAWTPPFNTLFTATLAMTVLSVCFNTIPDCDEVYNYWEPLHRLLAGRGFQTWEYSPDFALRSWLYIALHAAAVRAAAVVAHVPSRVGLFFLLRALFAFAAAYTTSIFVQAVSHRFGGRVALFTWGAILPSAGFFIASTAFLPSSFSMLVLMLAFSCWLNGRDFLAILLTGVAGLVGWPFCVLLAAPIGIEILVRRGPVVAIAYGLAALPLIVIPLYAADRHYYGTELLAVWNLIVYNIRGSGGSDLYGVEPASFYLLNGLLNFNAVFVLALVALPVVLATPRVHPKVIPAVLCFNIWLAAMMLLPHKEERFLFVAYPFLALNAAFVLHRLPDRVAWGTLAVAAAVSVSRVMALTMYFGAPIEVYKELHEHLAAKGEPAVVCVGSEWYRFPSSFFLPDGVELEFVEAGFHGQLPRHFDPGPRGTAATPPDMNDANAEEPARYVPLARCDYLVGPEGRDAGGELLHSARFLRAWETKFPWRSFYVPVVSEAMASFGEYEVWRLGKA